MWKKENGWPPVRRDGDYRRTNQALSYIISNVDLASYMYRVSSAKQFGIWETCILGILKYKTYNCKAYLSMLAALTFVTFKANGYTFRGRSSAIFSFASLSNRCQNLKERNCFRAAISFLKEKTSFEATSYSEANRHEKCVTLKQWQKNYGSSSFFRRILHGQ